MRLGSLGVELELLVVGLGPQGEFAGVPATAGKGCGCAWGRKEGLRVCLGAEGRAAGVLGGGR